MAAPLPAAGAARRQQRPMPSAAGPRAAPSAAARRAPRRRRRRSPRGAFWPTNAALGRETALPGRPAGVHRPMPISRRSDSPHPHVAAQKVVLPTPPKPTTMHRTRETACGSAAIRGSRRASWVGAVRCGGEVSRLPERSMRTQVGVWGEAELAFDGRAPMALDERPSVCSDGCAAVASHSATPLASSRSLRLRRSARSGRRRQSRRERRAARRSPHARG